MFKIILNGSVFDFFYAPNTPESNNDTKVNTFEEFETLTINLKQYIRFISTCTEFSRSVTLSKKAKMLYLYK